MQQSETIGSLVAAIAKAQLEVRNPALDRLHPHFKGFRYASLGSHLDAIREPFSRHGLIVTQGVTSSENQVGVTTMIAHSSGEWMRSTVSMSLPERATAQNLGAIVTYLRRYAIASIAMLTGDDDTDADEDRSARQDKPKPPAPAPIPPAPAAQPKRDVFDTAPAGKSKPARSGREWGRSGIEVVRPTKIMERDQHRSAVLCTHPDTEFGSQWIAVPVAMMSAVTVDRSMELTWAWNDVGMFREAVEIRPAPKLRDLVAKTEEGR